MATTTYTINPNDYGDGFTADEVNRIAAAEAAAIRRMWPSVVVSVISGMTEEDRFAGEWEDIAQYRDEVWDRILDWGFNGGPPADDIVAAWDAE